MKAPKISLRKLDESVHDRDALILFCFKGEVGKFIPVVKKAVGKDIAEKLTDFAAARGFKGGAGQSLYYPTKDKHITLLVGLGSRKSFKIDIVRRATAHSLKLIEKLRISKAVAVLAGRYTSAIKESDLVGAAAEGYLLGAYEFDKYKTKLKDKFSASDVELAIERVNKGAELALTEAEHVAEIVNSTRDMQNDNADDVNPETFVNQAEIAAKEDKLKMTVIGGDQLKTKGLRLIHAVGRASKWKPQLIMLEYYGDKSRKNNLTALVGKGVTFDTGGVNLKPADSMIEQMHLDMSGAATVLHAIKLASRLKLKTNILAVMPVAENAIGGNAIKPGSVVKAYNGKSVEIANTDAEGRLILADALAYVADKYKPTRIIDIATLTGSIIAALSFFYAGLITNNEKISKGLLDASEVTSEKIWRMPLDNDFRQTMRGTKSDLTNISKGGGDSTKAAAFLENFTAKIPWAHLDIAGTSMLPKPSGYQPQGGTGFGVRLLVEYLRKNPRF